MNTWLMSSETGGTRVVPRAVQITRGRGVALLVHLETPGAPVILGERVWSLSGPGIEGSVLFRTVSTRRARKPGMMVIRGIRMVDEGRSSENNTIQLIRSLLDLEVVDASHSCSPGPGRGLPEETEPVCRTGQAVYGGHDGTCA